MVAELIEIGVERRVVEARDGHTGRAGRLSFLRKAASSGRLQTVACQRRAAGASWRGRELAGTG
eukprot:scaffold89646_cov63-Phaeocystis_antarctica.AAC.1